MTVLAEELGDGMKFLAGNLYEGLKKIVESSL